MGQQSPCVALTALPRLAADSAVLRNGFAIRHQRREVIGTVTRLFVNADGSSFVDIPTAEIDHFEAVPDEEAAAQHRVERSKTIRQPPANLPQPLDLNQVVKARAEPIISTQTWSTV